MERYWKKWPDKSVYVLVHAEDFAIQKSMIRRDHNELRKSIRTRCILNQRHGVPIILTDLAFDEPPLPDYLKEFTNHVLRVPNYKTGNLQAQVNQLKRVLQGMEGRTHLVFGGGWKDACLRYTINNTCTRTPRLRLTETSTESATLELPGNRDRNITVAIDWDNVF